MFSAQTASARSLIGVLIGACISPFTQRGLDEALGLAVGFGRVGSGEDLAQAQTGAGSSKHFRSVAGSVVCHDALDADTETGVIGDGGFEEGDGTFLALVGHDLHEGHARGIVDADVDELPADADVTIDDASSSSGNAVPDGADPAKLFDIEMDEFAWCFAFIAADRFGWLQGAKLVEAKPFEDATNGCRRDPNFGRICLPVWRCRRNASMASHAAW